MIQLRAVRQLRILHVGELFILVERLLGVARARADFLVVEVGAAGVETLIVFVIKPIEFNGGLIVRLVREVRASEAGFLDLWAISGLLKCIPGFERVVGIVVRGVHWILVYHEVCSVRFGKLSPSWLIYSNNLSSRLRFKVGNASTSLRNSNRQSDLKSHQ